MIARVADRDVNPRFAIGAGAASEEFRMVGIGRKGEAGRPPGALANSVRPESLQSLGGPAHPGAHEAAAALGWSEIIADDLLNAADAVAERLEILFREPRPGSA